MEDYLKTSSVIIRTRNYSVSIRTVKLKKKESNIAKNRMKKVLKNAQILKILLEVFYCFVFLSHLSKLFYFYFIVLCFIKIIQLSFLFPNS